MYELEEGGLDYAPQQDSDSTSTPLLDNAGALAAVQRQLSKAPSRLSRSSPVPRLPLGLRSESKTARFEADATPRSDAGLITTRDVNLNLGMTPRDDEGVMVTARDVRLSSPSGSGGSGGGSRCRPSDSELPSSRLNSPSPLQQQRRKLLAEAAVMDATPIDGAAAIGETPVTGRHSFGRKGTTSFIRRGTSNVSSNTV